MNRRALLGLLGVFGLMALLVAVLPDRRQELENNALATVFAPTATTAPTRTAVPYFTPLPLSTDWRQDYVFADITVRDIVTVNLRDPNSGTTFTITRAADGAWTAPNSAGTLDTEAASLIAQSLVLLNFNTLIEAEDADLQTYGFDPNGILFVEFIVLDGTAHVLAVGGLSTDRNNYYVIVDDRPGVYRCGRGPIDFLIQSLLSPPLT